MHVSKHFDEPYLSCSFREFWGKRWNITASVVLRDAVFLPVLYFGTKPSSAKSKRPTHLRRAVAVMCAFVASGLAHELILAYVLPEATYQWTTFFVLNGVVTIAEDYLRHARSHPITRWWRSLQPSRWLERAVTIGALLLMAEIWFIPPVASTGLTKRLVAELLVA